MSLLSGEGGWCENRHMWNFRGRSKGAKSAPNSQNRNRRPTDWQPKARELAVTVGIRINERRTRVRRDGPGHVGQDANKGWGGGAR